MSTQQTEKIEKVPIQREYMIGIISGSGVGSGGASFVSPSLEDAVSELKELIKSKARAKASLFKDADGIVITESDWATEECQLADKGVYPETKLMPIPGTRKMTILRRGIDY